MTLTFKFLSGCISETVICSKLILDRDIIWGVGVRHHVMTLIRFLTLLSDLHLDIFVRALSQKLQGVEGWYFIGRLLRERRCALS